MKLIGRDGKELVPGQPVTDFRGEKHTFIRGWEPGTSQGGRGGRVQLDGNDGPIYFPGVIGADFKRG